MVHMALLPNIFLADKDNTYILNYKHLNHM